MDLEYKIELLPEQEILMPKSARAVSVNVHGGEIYVLAKVNPVEKSELKTFFIYGVDQPHMRPTSEHIKTFQYNGRAFLLFEKGRSV